MLGLVARKRLSMTAAVEDDAPLLLALGIHATWKFLHEAGNIPGDVEPDDFLNIHANRENLAMAKTTMPVIHMLQ